MSSIIRKMEKQITGERGHRIPNCPVCGHKMIVGQSSDNGELRWICTGNKCLREHKINKEGKWSV